MKFIKGKWYKYGYSKPTHYLKCEKITVNDFHFSAIFSIATNILKENIGSNNSISVTNIIKEASIEELTEFLPKNHPDLKRLDEEVCYEIY